MLSEDDVINIRRTIAILKEYYLILLSIARALFSIRGLSIS
jgi:hypothetical protein